MFTVKQVAALTGVGESTLRVWERRYDVVRPARSPGGYRLYDDSQLALLREMAGLVESGVPASVAADAVRSTTSPARGAALEGLPGEGDLVDAAASLDPGRLAGVVDRAFASGPFEQVAEEWLQPQLTRLGDAWADNRLTVAQEHFASAGLMRAISAVYDAARRDVDGPLVLIGLPARQRHELVLFAFAACLRRRGVGTVYLGADVPVDEWVGAMGRHRARAAVLGVSSRAAAAVAQEVVDRVAALTPPRSIWIGGSRRAAVTGVHLLPDGVAQAAAQLHLGLTAGQV